MPHRVHTGPDEHPETCKKDAETPIGLLDRVAARISATGTPLQACTTPKGPLGYHIRRY